MDMEGRPLGTERPSVSVASDGASSQRFQALLAARAGAAEGDVQASMEDDFAARITDGRTDAAEVEPDVRDSVRRRPEGDARPSQDEARDADARDAREPDARREAVERGGDGHRQRDGESLSGEERARHVVDAADAEGASEEGSDAPPTASLPQTVTEQAPLELRAALPRAQSALPHAAPAGAAPALAAFGGAPAAGASRGPTVAPVAPVEGDRSAAARRATTAAPARSTAAERAEAILEQLRAQIRTGAREATLHLRPGDLGRIAMRVRVEGGGVQASIAAESPETLRVLEAHAPELRAWLAKDAGGPVELELGLIDPGGADAGDTSAGDPGSRGEAAQGQGGDGRSGARRAGSSASAAAAPAPEALARALTRTNTDGVDLVA
ncbi:MAG: flagellar hook-length control protein FliK [Planctomycetota bacterium]